MKGLHIQDYLVEALINTKLYEMADDRQEFYRECKHLYPQIIENVGCILYAQENKVSTQNIRHWLGELSSYVYKLRKTKIKLSKQRVLLQMLDTNEADNRNVLRDDLEDKFNKEQFDIEEFSYESQGRLIHFMYNEFVEIICTSIKNCVNPKQDTYQRLSEALNITI